MRLLNDDLNTPEAIAELHAMAKSLNKAADVDKPTIKARLLAAGAILGILHQDPEDWFQSSASGEELDGQAIEGLIAERTQSKLDKDYARADEIRTLLAEQGVVLEDSPQGTKWRRE
jgi:cysteinyl-tRNA synthetase